MIAKKKIVKKGAKQEDGPQENSNVFVTDAGFEVKRFDKVSVNVPPPDLGSSVFIQEKPKIEVYESSGSEKPFVYIVPMGHTERQEGWQFEEPSWGVRSADGIVGVFQNDRNRAEAFANQLAGEIGARVSILV